MDYEMLDPPPPPPPPPSNGFGSLNIPGRHQFPETSPVTDVMGTFRHVKLFRRNDIKEGKPRPYILSLDYDDTGELLMTSESDETIQLYNVKEGRHDKSLLSKKYGVKLAMFTHTNSSIIYASTKANDAIRYLATHDNSFIRYFEGHTGPVTCLAMHPGSDKFLSCSKDKTVRLWDVGSKNWAGSLILQSPFLAAWDPSGTVFAVASPDAASILLYSYAAFEKGPFKTIDLVKEAVESVGAGNGSLASFHYVARGWSKLEFSNDGKSLLLSTRGNGHFLLDAFDGSLKAYLRKPESGARGDSSSAGPSAAGNAKNSNNNNGGSGGPRATGPSNRVAPGELPVPNGDPASGSSSVNAPGGYWMESAGDSAFSPDGRYVLSGASISGKRAPDVLVWDTMAAWSIAGSEGSSNAAAGAGTARTSGPGGGRDREPAQPKTLGPGKVLDPMYTLDDKRDASVLAFNPRFNFFATADQDLVFWTPDFHQV